MRQCFSQHPPHTQSVYSETYKIVEKETTYLQSGQAISYTLPNAYNVLCSLLYIFITL